MVTLISVLFNEPKLLKYRNLKSYKFAAHISVLFNEPKLLKFEDNLLGNL